VVPAAEVGDLLRPLAPQVLGAVARRYGHFDLAEDATQEALLAASVQWPRDGLPQNPKAWLIAVASRRLTDLLRSEQARRRREDAVAEWAVTERGAAWVDERGPGEADDTLILLFMCCHPSLSTASQVALTLRAVGGLSTAEIEPILGSTPTGASTRSAPTCSRWPASVPQRSRHTGPQLGQRPTSSNSATSTSRSAAWPKAQREPDSDVRDGRASPPWRSPPGSPVGAPRVRSGRASACQV